MYESNPRVPMPPSPPPRADPQAFGIFFGQIPHHAGPFFGQMPSSIGIFRGQIPCPPGWSDKTQIDFRKPERGFQPCHFYYFFVYQFNVYIYHFFSVYIVTI